jgi:periplasmic protein TonB
LSYTEPRDSGRRAIGFSAVVVFHIILVYALVNGLARKIVEVIQQPLETKIIEEVKPPPVDKPPPPPPPKLAAPPPPFIPPPEIRIDTPPPVTNAITAVSTVKPAVEAPIPKIAPAPVAGPARTSAVVDARNCTKPEYPSASLRAQEVGLVVLQFLIDVDGNALEGKVERSSGYRRLDDAARRALSLCKFKPGTENGKAVQSWARIEYLWKIDD